VADIILKPLTALGHAGPVIETIGAITIAERDDTALASLAIRRGREGDISAAAAKAGIPLPPPGQSASAAPWGAFWLTPEMWMVEAPIASHEDIRPALLAIFGDAASVTEQTGAWVRFDLTGPALVALLERLSNFDLGPAPEGAATRTVIDHIGCYLIKRRADLVTIYGPRASAESLHHALVVAAHSL
jgi:sarcosine oxidase, subunit gamma